MIEEAYNQERGVVQHISSLVHNQRSASYAYQFTQEWPAAGIANQLSYTMTFLRADASSGAGIGDTRLNYRYQLAGDGFGKVAIAPRLTSILPTGDYRKGRGAGALGVEAWLPVSVVLTSQLVAHGNVGLTLTPHARNTDGAHATTQTWTSGGSLIWLARPTFNILVETILQRVENVSREDRVVRESSAIVSPGLRWAYNFPSGLQIVPGLAVPLGVGRTAGERSVLVYLSFEHPFTRSATAKASAQ
ncbi:MAG: transporter [Gemmatimonadaceae bacterium]